VRATRGSAGQQQETRGQLSSPRQRRDQEQERDRKRYEK